MSQTELALRSGLSRETVAKIETRRRRDVYLGEAVALCRALDIDLAAMLNEQALTVAIREVVV